jgi:hypothetical protein
MVEEETSRSRTTRKDGVRLNDIALWNIVAIGCFILPAFLLISACLELLPTHLFAPAIGLIFLIFLVFVILIANVVTLWKEDKEKSKKEGRIK